MDGWKKVLGDYKKKRQAVKVLFIFPNVQGVVVRSGKIIRIESDCFELDDIKEGLNWYAYNWISSVSKVEVLKDGNKK